MPPPPVLDDPIVEKPSLDAGSVPPAGDAPSSPQDDVQQSVEPDVRAGQGSTVE